jgi:hypothetical protein
VSKFILKLRPSTPLLSCPAAAGGGAPPRGDDDGAAAPLATPSSFPFSLMAQRSELMQGAGVSADRAMAASGSTAATRLEDSAGGGGRKGGNGDEARRQLHGDGEARRDLLPPFPSAFAVVAGEGEEIPQRWAQRGAALRGNSELEEERRARRLSSSSSASPSSGRPLLHLEVLHDGVDVSGRSSTARPASLPSAGAREGAECAGPAPADEGAPALLRIRRRWEANAFLASS